MKRRTLIILVIGVFAFIFLSRGCCWFGGPAEESYPDNTIAVVEIDTPILTADETIRQLREVRENEDIRGVVVRVNTPGGSVGASQELYESVRRLDEVKPVVVSMGSVAASGGYYLALGARSIFANPGTITGSIGVLMEHVDLSRLFDWARVKPQTLKSGKMKDVGTSERPFTAEEKAFLEGVLKEMHAQFKEAVAEARELDEAVVDELADGRIYTGAKALELGLIDALGNLEDAIDEAAKLAAISDKPNVVYPFRPDNWFEEIFSENATQLTDLAEAGYTILKRGWFGAYYWINF